MAKIQKMIAYIYTKNIIIPKKINYKYSGYSICDHLKKKMQ